MDAFTEFVVQVERPLLRTAYLLTGDHGHAEDLVQTTLVKAHRHWDRVQRADSPLAYVRRVLVTSHVSWRRRLSTSEQVIESVPDRAGEDLQARQATTDLVRTALQELSPRVRAVVVLRWFEDLTEVETARVLGCSPSTVSTHAARGLATLRRYLDGVEAAEHPDPYARRTS
ncbi:RNA polymerase subunit sigma-24 [Geodermatophilus sp. Leaf369]|uniref:SigE family RNA polymerase sigma factor n=1 Tax=Geodermatophilus sp. Leaf369 TaxID=1736354 RepID=UPI0007015DDB|nr:SigE family RNA polymerase sigma factor [Geodermatophilus sp. Leaf369]KQS58392.1 RNA polymerase subunit sigma-24 [Geodermatophilus sp. Leaf369]